MKVAETYLIDTQYGLNLLIKTEDGFWYQQIHQPLEYSGGGAARWILISDQQVSELLGKPQPISNN